MTCLRLATAAIFVPSIANNSAPNSDCSWQNRIMAEVRNGLERRRQPVDQPHHLDVTPRFRLQPPGWPAPGAGTHKYKASKDPQVRKAGVPSLPPQLGKPQSRQVQRLHIRIDHPYRIVNRHNFIQNLGKQCRLVSRLTSDVRHHDIESKSDSRLHQRTHFHTAWCAGTTAALVRLGALSLAPTPLPPSCRRWSSAWRTRRRH